MGIKKTGERLAVIETEIKTIKDGQDEIKDLIKNQHEVMNKKFEKQYTFMEKTFAKKYVEKVTWSLMGVFGTIFVTVLIAIIV